MSLSKVSPLYLLPLGMVAITSMTTACTGEEAPQADSGMEAINDTGTAESDAAFARDAGSNGGSTDAATASLDATSGTDAALRLDAANPVSDVGALPEECTSQVRFSLSGVITEASSRDGEEDTLAARLNGQRINAVIGFDPSVRDSRERGDFGQYRQPPATSEMTVQIPAAELSFADPRSFFVEPFNDFESRGDRLNFVGNFEGEGVPNEAQIVVVFWDASGRAIDSIASPTSIPTLEVWRDGGSIEITSNGREDPRLRDQRRQACEGLSEGDRCRAGEVEGQCNRTREGMLCRGESELPVSYRISSRIERVVDLCAR